MVREIDERGESTKYYDRFIDLYIKLYYEPLVEDYDELKYFTRNHDMAMHKLIDQGKPIRAISFKE